jgi:two-component system, sensor histidine kinase and response regulator
MSAAVAHESRRRVLLAEDNPINQQIVMELLETRGHTVKLAGTGAEVLSALDVDTFDIILMDVQMPVMDGFETAAAIRSREKNSGKRIPIIAITGLASESDRQRCLDAGMDGYLGKPIRATDLFEVVERGTTK